jgi:hypothetical protein
VAADDSLRTTAVGLFQRVTGSPVARRSPRTRSDLFRALPAAERPARRGWHGDGRASTTTSAGPSTSTRCCGHAWTVTRALRPDCVCDAHGPRRERERWREYRHAGRPAEPTRETHSETWKTRARRGDVDSVGGGRGQGAPRGRSRGQVALVVLSALPFEPEELLSRSLGFATQLADRPEAAVPAGLICARSPGRPPRR